MDYFHVTLSEREVASHSILALAHLGDSVYELMVRTRLLINADLTNRTMHNETLNYVNASAQFEAYQKIKDILTPFEADIFRRGRNARVKTVPRNADRAKYHTATGVEALFGALWLSGNHERLNQLFEIIVDP
ncbi:MAG: ribonuclease III [Clostridiales bacterium]|nr:ribonuclease III [Clostridiales bacterium]